MYLLRTVFSRKVLLQLSITSLLLFCLVSYFHCQHFTSNSHSHTHTSLQVDDLTGHTSQLKQHQQNVNKPPAEGWFCDSAHYNTRDGCHCLCGAHDPDCDNIVNLDSTASNSALTLDTAAAKSTSEEKKPVAVSAINCPCPEQQLLMLSPLPYMFFFH